MTELLKKLVRPAMIEPTLVLAFEGWNDAGESASTAAKFVSDSLSLVPLAEIESDEFFDFTVQRPNVRLDDQGVRQIDWPTNRFLFGTAGPDLELIVGLGVEPHLRWRAFTDLIAEYARELNVKRAVLLGAYLADVVYSRPVQVTGFSSDPDWLPRLEVPTSRYEGPTGIVGVLADRFREDGIEVLSLWAGLPHYITATPNPRGALALLQKISAALDLKLDETPLRDEAAEFEQRISEIVSADPELTEYVRQLKRREFAQ